MTGSEARDFIDELQRDWMRQRPELDTEPMGAVLRIQALARLLNDRVSNRLQELGLQWWQYDVLSALRRQGEPFTMAASELATAGMLTSGAMTHRIDRLEESGLVRRLQDPNDRRRVLVQLTRRGTELTDRASDVRFETASRSLAGLDKEQRRQLSRLLRELLLTFEERENPQ